MVEIFLNYIYDTRGKRPSITCEDLDCKYNRSGECYHRPLRLEITRYGVKCLSRKPRSKKR